MLAAVLTMHACYAASVAFGPLQGYLVTELAIVAMWVGLKSR